MQSAELGTYLVDGNGMTLYYFTKDSPGVSNANANVIANWPVFYASSVIVTDLLNATDFGSITRADGAKQTTFKDYPLYFFIQDKAPVDTKGQGVNNVWFVVDPEKFVAPVTLSLVAKSFAFDKSTITVKAGARVTVNFDNQDGAPHNLAIYTNSSATTSIFVGTVITGPSQTTYFFAAPDTPGSYFFRCDIHPNMNGTFVVQ